MEETQKPVEAIPTPKSVQDSPPIQVAEEPKPIAEEPVAKVENKPINSLEENVKAHNEEVIEKDDKNQKKVKKASALHKVKILSIVLSIKHLSIMLKSGLAIEDALKTLKDQATDAKLREVWTSVEADVHKGKNLSEAMGKFPKVFSQVIVSLINAGEQGGTLERNLVYLADYLKKDYELKKKIKGALFYPSIIFAITIMESMGVVFFILPKLESLFNSVKNVPAYTIFIMQSAKLMRDNIILVALGLIIFGVLFTIFFKTKIGKKLKDRLALNFPIVKLLTVNSLLTTFSRTLGILLESGIPIANALQIASKTIENGLYEKALNEVYENVKKGQSLAQALTKYPNYFPPTFVKMIEVGESTGSLEENLLYLHEFYSEEVQDMSNNLTTLLEPILLVFIGVMIGGLAISIVGPIYSLTSSIND